MRAGLLCIISALAILVAGFPHAARAGAPDPYQIYDRARAVWAASSYPPYISYTIDVSVNDHGVVKQKHYRALYETARNRVFVDTVSEEERVDPHTPEGVNFSLEPKRQQKTLFKRRVGRPESAVDFLGVPMLAPNYSFGVVTFVPKVAESDADRAALVEEIRREFNDPMTPQKAAELNRGAGLQQIASVVSAQRDYQITYDGVEPIDGTPCYHLSLRPVHLSDRLRLRELWVDQSSYAIRRIQTAGNFTNDRFPWTIEVATIGGAEYLVSEQTEQPVSDGPHTYQSAQVSFQGMAPAAAPEHPWDLVTPAPADLLAEPR